MFNAPLIFSTVFSIIKPFMDPIIAAKIDVYSGVPTKKLLALMPAEVLPQEYGGRGTADFPQVAIADA